MTTCCVTFDAASMRQQVRFDKCSESFTGLVTTSEMVDKNNISSKVADHLTLVAIRSLPLSKFRMPVGLFFQRGTGNKKSIKAEVQKYLKVSFFASINPFIFFFHYFFVLSFSFEIFHSLSSSLFFYFFCTHKGFEGCCLHRHTIGNM